jgi:hypothetical protein
MAWNMMGGTIDWSALPWVMDYLGVDDADRLVLDLIVIRDWMTEK